MSVSRWEEEGWTLDTAEDREIFQSGVQAPGPGPGPGCVSYGPRRRQSLVPAGVEITISNSEIFSNHIIPP